MGIDKNSWKSVRELKEIESDSGQRGLSEGRGDFTEPLEVRTIDGAVFFREMAHEDIPEVPEVFSTQYGFYDNHEDGAFSSSLSQLKGEKTGDLTGASREVPKDSPLFSLVGDPFMGGYFTDMFDCGDFIFAISTTEDGDRHNFKIMRINQNYRVTTMYDNSTLPVFSSYEYVGRYENNLGFIVVVSGVRGAASTDEASEKTLDDRTILFQLYTDGSIDVDRAWNISLAPATSIAVRGDDVYFAQNRMITVLNTLTGEVTHLIHDS